MERTKLIEYAYPSSTTATKAGHGLTGCWFITIQKNGNVWESEKTGQYFKDPETAEHAANARPEPYHKWHCYFLKYKEEHHVK